MKAAFCVNQGSIEVREVPLPQPRGHEVLVRVHACGICGSDLHSFSGTVPPSPECMGHEISGSVAAAGALAKRVAVGERIVIEPILVCCACTSCQSGNHQLCRELRLLGATAPGGMAEFVVVPDYALHPVPAGLDLDLAALAEPTAVAIHALRLAGPLMGRQLMVLGAGSIGLLCLLAATSGGARAAITARHPHQRELASAFGAQAVFDPAERAAIAAYCEDKRVDLVLETVGGNADTLGDALDLVMPGGRIITLGVFTKTLSLNPLQFILKEVCLQSSVFYSRAGGRSDFSLALDLIAREQRRLHHLVTHKVPLEEAQRGFSIAADKKKRAVKVLVKPGDL